MSGDAAAVRPALEDAVAVSSKKQRYVQAPKSDETKNKKGPSSLFARCQAVVVANLERYPPEIFGMLTESDWEDIVRCKHRKTAPQKGSGGLDGTGRRTPAIGQSFLAEVEEMNSHLADSPVSDLLVWKDCVEFQFSMSGLTRPRAMLLPWPLLVKKIADQAEILMAMKKKEDIAEENEEPLEVSEEQTKAIIDATQKLKDSPMNVLLLKESGIGKVLKKIIKASSNRQDTSIFKRLEMTVSSGPTSLVAARANSEKELSVLKTLEMLLQTWMDLAASRGVEMNTSTGKRDKKAMELYQQDAEDLRCVEQCKTWRQLFKILKGRAEQKRLNLGQKMRDNRKKDNAMRPKIVKVRPANPRREQMFNRGAPSTSWAKGSTFEKDGGAKMLQVRKEAAVQAARQKAGINAYKKQSSGFGAAVAFASVTKLSAKDSMAQQQARKRKAAAIVALGNGKQMAVPQKAMRMQGTKFSTKKVRKNNPDNQPRRNK